MNKQTMWMAGLGIAATSALATAMILGPRERGPEARLDEAAPAKAPEKTLVAQAKPAPAKAAQVKKANWPFGSAARTETITVPEGTELPVRLAQSLSTERNAAGETFTATLDEPLMLNGKLIAAAGSRVEGALTEVVDSGRVKGLARMSMRLPRLELNGKWWDIATATRSFEAENTRKRDAGVIAGSAPSAAVARARRLARAWAAARAPARCWRRKASRSSSAPRHASASR
jgi:hypothetical protein